jgi:carboxypeptidase D
MDGLFLEHGPFRLEQNEAGEWNIKLHPYSWHKSPAYMVYVDQPVGTGLSFTRKKNYCRDDMEINYDFHYFLQNFLLTFSDLFLMDHPNSRDELPYQMKRPFYMSGESYAGHYIASMVDYILQRNTDTNVSTSPLVYIPVNGAAIGNGYVNPYYQYSGSDVAYATGLIDAAQRAQLDFEETICHDEMKRGNVVADACYSLMESIVQQSFGGTSKYIVSIYDTRRTELRNVDRRFPPGHKDVEMYLGGLPGTNGAVSMVDYKRVLKAIHAEESIDAGLRYQECTDPPYFALQGTEGTGVVDQLIRILEHESKPRILFFNGMNDIICNHVGNERLLEALPWKHRDDWILSSRYAWGDGIDGSSKPVGYVKEYENLIFLKILDSSHMVPMDSPAVSLEMMRTLLMKTSFQIREQTLQRSLPPSTQDCEPCDDCRNSSQIPAQPEFVFKSKSGAVGFFSALVFCFVLFVIHRKLSIHRRGFTQFRNTQDNEVI